jgi:sugar-specific transcriptional regulator TrmB
MAVESLKALGLNDKQIQVYLTVLQQGKATAVTIGRITKINRTTVYSVAKELIEKGLIAEDLGDATSYFVAKPPQELQYLVEREEQALQKKKRAASEVVDELQKIMGNTAYAAPKINFVDEKHLEKYLYKQTPIWDASVVQYDSHWWGFQDKTFVKHYEKWIDWYWEAGGKPHVQLKLLTNQSAEEIKKKKFTRRQIKFWSSPEEFTATTWILGDYVTSIITSQRPHYLVDMHDPVLAHNLRGIFKKLWNETK